MFFFGNDFALHSQLHRAGLSVQGVYRNEIEMPFAFLNARHHSVAALVSAAHAFAVREVHQQRRFRFDTH